MTNFLYYYFIIALSGAIMSNFYLYNPILTRMTEMGRYKEHVFIKAPTLTRIVFFIGCLIVTPLLIRPLISEQSRTSFIEGLIEGATTND